MDKRTLLAVALAALVLLGWSLFTSKLYHVGNTVVTEQTPAPVTPVSAKVLPTESVLQPSSSTFQVSQEKFALTFIESSAAIKEAVFPGYGAYVYPLQSGLLFGNPEMVFRKERVSTNSVQFSYADADKKILKEFNFSPSAYEIELRIEVHNLSSREISFNLPLVLGVLDFSRDQMQSRFQDVTISLKEKTLHLNARKDSTYNDVQFIGIRDRYFCLIAQPETPGWQGTTTKLNPQTSEINLKPANALLAPGQQVTYTFRIYLGPQDLQHIKRVNPAWTALIYFGSFDLIGHFLLQVLDFMHRLAQNWGLVIVCLSVLIYFVLFPLSLKQMRSMKQMQVLQPAIEELRKKLKDNPQKLNKEIMELYRQNKVNPLSGCLPMVLQIPIFFALYQVLIRSIALKGAHFLWIKDLSEPDRFITLPTTLPILGNEINILPILMAIGMFLQQKMTLKTTGGEAAEQQKMMLVILPIMFGFIFYRMPAGLVLYWFVNSTLMLIYQFRINRTK